MAVLVLALVLSAAAAIVWLSVRLAGLFAESSAPPEPADPLPGLRTYGEEITAALADLSRLERQTLRHLRRNGMRTFTADRDSPTLQRLIARHLLSTAGSSALPSHNHPYVIPDEVWRRLEGLLGEPDLAGSRRPEPSGPRREAASRPELNSARLRGR